MRKKTIILLVVLLALSWVTTVSTLINTPIEYNQYITTAQELESKQLYIAANEEYDKALLIKPDDVSVLVSKANNLLLLGEKYQFISLCETIIEEYKDHDDALQLLIDYYIEKNNMKDAVTYLCELSENGNDSELLVELLAQYGGEYETLYGSYEELGTIYGDSIVYIKNELYGLVDEDGDLIVSPEYSVVSNMSLDNGWIYVEGEENYFINDDGNRMALLEDGYRAVTVFSEGQVVAIKDEKYGYLDESMDEICEFQWDDLTNIEGGIGAAKQSDKWAIIEADGDMVTDYIYNDVAIDAVGFCSYNKVIFVQIGTEWMLVDKKGEQVGEETFEDVKAFVGEEPAAVKQNGKWGFADADGEIVIEPQYVEAQSYRSGIAGVMTNDKWGFIDIENNTLVEDTFEEVTAVSENGIASVKLDNWQMIEFYKFN